MVENQELSFSVSLAESDWDSAIKGWRAAVLRIPSLSVTGIFSNGTRIDPDRYQVEPNHHRIRWIGDDQPLVITVDVKVASYGEQTLQDMQEAVLKQVGLELRRQRRREKINWTTGGITVGIVLGFASTIMIKACGSFVGIPVSVTRDEPIQIEQLVPGSDYPSLSSLRPLDASENEKGFDELPAGIFGYSRASGFTDANPVLTRESCWSCIPIYKLADETLAFEVYVDQKAVDFLSTKNREHRAITAYNRSYGDATKPVVVRRSQLATGTKSFSRNIETGVVALDIYASAAQTRRVGFVLQSLTIAQEAQNNGAKEGGAKEGGAKEGGAKEGGAKEGGAKEGGAKEEAHYGVVVAWEMPADNQWLFSDIIWLETASAKEDGTITLSSEILLVKVPVSWAELPGRYETRENGRFWIVRGTRAALTLSGEFWQQIGQAPVQRQTVEGRPWVLLESKPKLNDALTAAILVSDQIKLLGSSGLSLPPKDWVLGEDSYDRVERFDRYHGDYVTDLVVLREYD